MPSWTLFIFWLLVGAGTVWLWHAHGIRERALSAVQRHCTKHSLTLLDENVAFQKFMWQRDSRGHKRLARVYGFEFTVTGEQRLAGSITLFGESVQRIDLAPHPIVEPNPPAPEAAIPPPATSAHKGQVIQMSDWRKQHPKPESARRD